MSAGRHALVVGSAPVPGAEAHYGPLIRASDLLIAADAGLEVCLEAVRVPDVCVGDFDSTSPAALERAASLGAEVRRYPAVKDESDLDLAVLAARQLGANRLTIVAAFTGRLDHTLAALGTLSRAADLEAVAKEPEWRAFALEAEQRPTLRLTEPLGTVLSLMAAMGPAEVSIGGVSYPLHHHDLAALSSLGLSNVASSAVQEVTVHRGACLVLVNALAGGLPLS